MISCLQVRASHYSGVLSPSFICRLFSREQQKLTMHLKYTEVVGICFPQNMELGDNTLNNQGSHPNNSIFALIRFDSSFKPMGRSYASMVYAQLSQAASVWWWSHIGAM